MEYFIFLAGFILGVFITRIVIDIRSGGGTLKIDNSDPNEKDIWRIEFNEYFDPAKKKRFILKVELGAHLRNTHE